MSVFALGLLAAASAHAASSPDLVTTIIPPASATVEVAATWQVQVENTGNRNASGTSLAIQLPETNTSPTVHVMGVTGTASSGCTWSGTRLLCDLGTVARRSARTVSFTIALPQSAGTLDFEATASTSTHEPDTSDNTDSATASLLYASPSFSGTVDVRNRHCTGTGLEAFFECELYPSSFTEHTATLHDDVDQSISFASAPGYGGSWEVTGDELWFEYTYAGAVVAEFLGQGVSATCWEGLVLFNPDDGYVAPYEVCLD